MSIYAIYNWEFGLWTFDGDYPLPDTNVHIGFGRSRKNFKNVGFGFSASQDGAGIIYESSYPKPGEQFVESDQSYLSVDAVNPLIFNPVNLRFWVTENGLLVSEHLFTYTPDFPPKPYESWVWDVWSWVPPVPKPDGDYEWNEESGAWVPFEAS
jgi:hypothetical protein